MSEVRRIWDEGAALCDEIYACNVAYHRSHEAIIDFLPRDRPTHILDLGAGTGTLAQEILAKLPHSSVACIDFSANMLAECRRKLARFGRRVQCIHADIAMWDPPETYDAVVACNTLVYKELDIRACYARYAAALKPMGLFLNSTVVQRPAALPEHVVDSLGLADRPPPSDQLARFAEHGRRIATFEEDSLALALPVDEHIRLMAAGGLMAECVWQYLTQAVLLGVRRDDAGTQPRPRARTDRA